MAPQVLVLETMLAVMGKPEKTARRILGYRMEETHGFEPGMNDIGQAASSRKGILWIVFSDI